MSKDVENAESCYESAEDDVFVRSVNDIQSPTTTSDDSASESPSEALGVQLSRKWSYRFVKFSVGFVVCLALLLSVAVAIITGLMSSIRHHFSTENFTNVSSASLLNETHISLSSAVMQNVSNSSLKVGDTDAPKFDL